MEMMDINEVQTYTPGPEAMEMQKLQCAMVNFFKSQEVTNCEVKTNFQLNAHILPSTDIAIWGVTDASAVAKLGFENIRNDSLRFSASTSSPPSSGARKLMIYVDASARNVGGIVSAGGEELYFRVTVSWMPDAEAPLPGWTETLQLVRLGLAHGYKQEEDLHMFDHSELGCIKVTKKKGTKP
jgi:hypothetical protein